MKKTFFIICAITIFLAACSPSKQVPPAESTQTVTTTSVPSTPTATEIVLTPTSTPPPMRSLPVSLGTPVPASDSKITAGNVKDLQEVARYYGEINYSAQLTEDQRFLFVLDPDGLTKYDYSSMEPVVYVPLANNVSDLQMSRDGHWLVIQDSLVDLRDDGEPKVYPLSEKIDLLNSYSRTFSLSPDGSMVAALQVRCYDLCDHKLQIVSTEDFKVLHVSSGVSNQDLPTFSWDGGYLALIDMFIEAHPDGSTNPAGAAVSVWAVSDFTRVSSFPVKFPFHVADLAFSEDNRLLAVAQTTSIEIIDVLSGEIKATVSDLCESYEREVLFAPASQNEVLENSDCSASKWTISGDSATLASDHVPDLSRILFDKQGNPKEVPYSYPTTPNLRAYSEEFYFQFLNNDTVSFKSFDAETSDRHSCDLSLSGSSFACQSHAPEYNWQGSQLVLSEYRDVILAADGKYYGYIVDNSKVDIYPLENPNQILYSIPFRDYGFDLLALDPINNLVIYNIALSMSINRVIIQDMKDDRILEKWEGETFISSMAFSENGRYAAFCRSIGYYTSAENKDRLLLFDLSEKRTINNMDFNCNGAALAFTGDGKTLGVEYIYFPEPATFITRVMLLDTTPPYKKTYIDLDTYFYPYSLAFSRDGSMLALGCSSSDICFFDMSDVKEIYRLRVHSSVTNLAFSPDGNALAISSSWGLISLWAVPPYIDRSKQAQESPLSTIIMPANWDFNQEGYFEGWGEQDWQSSGFENIRVRNGYLSARVVDPATFIYSDEGLGIDASKYDQIAIRMRASAGNIAQLYFRHSSDDLSETMSIRFDIQPGDEFRTYTLYLGNIPGWNGTIDQMRLDPAQDAVGAAIDIDYIHLLSPHFSWDFNEQGNFEGWAEQDWKIGGLTDVRVTDGNLSATATDSGTLLYSNEGLNINTAKFTRIEIRMRVSEGNSANFYFRHENDDMSEEMSTIFELLPGPEFQTYVLDVGNIPGWKGTIYQLRLDPTYDAPGAKIDIDYIHLLP